MSFALVRYTGNGSTTTYSVPFTYRSTADVVVKVNGVTQTLTTHYSFPSTSSITFGSAPANNSVIEIRRSTSQSTRLVDYAAGSVFKESDLDNDSIQAFNMAQESIDIANDALTKDSTDQFDATSRRIKNVATPVDTNDAVSLSYFNATDLSGVTVNTSNVAVQGDGSAGSATGSGSVSNRALTLNLGLPIGATGAQGNAGNAATLAVGSVTTNTLDAGNSASVAVSNAGSSSSATLNFTFNIPRGNTGLQGIQGNTGDLSEAQAIALSIALG